MGDTKLWVNWDGGSTNLLVKKVKVVGLTFRAPTQDLLYIIVKRAV